LRDRCQSYFLTLRIPVDPVALDELLERAEKESLSHLHFLDQLLGAQADARRERAVARRTQDTYFAETKTLEGFNWALLVGGIDLAGSKHRTWFSHSSIRPTRVLKPAGGA
jgi:hypothetical protein